MKVRLVTFQLYESAENYLPFQLFLHHTNARLNTSENLVSRTRQEKNTQKSNKSDLLDFIH